jgi:hypothetical protein
MATKANWTVVFEDKMIIKNHAEGADEGIGYKINDDFSNIWAIQHGTPVTSDEVEYRDDTPHSSYDVSVLGDISQFSSKWDSAHLSKLQSDWDNNNVEGETEAEKIARLGERPTSYSS